MLTWGWRSYTKVLFSVKTVVERLKERTNSLLKDADNIFNMAVIKLPKAVRQMNWLEHCGKLDENACT